MQWSRHIKEGFDGKGIQRRTYARIQRKIDKALEDEEITNIELEESEVDLIKKRSIKQSFLLHGQNLLFY